MYRVRGDWHLRIIRDVFASKSCRTLPTFFRAIIIAATIVTSVVGLNRPSQALPSFARQTGQPCGTCHTDFPMLTPYGRLFKLNGYTTGGGKFRTTLFPTQDDRRSALADYAKKIDRENGTTLNGQPDTSNIWVPPISMMAIGGYTQTQTAQVAPICGGPYHCKDNFVWAPVSFFYGGAITEHIGAFAQVTYTGPPMGQQNIAPPIDPYTQMQWSWDNTDVRYANTASIGNLDIIYGITANNNPSVQDPWNTTPAWKWPQAASTVAPSGGAGPATSTLIDGGLGPGHVAGVGAYAFINNLLYLELAGYRPVSFSQQHKLGVDPYGAGMISGVAPYWRVALEPHWGNHWLELGAYGMSTRLRQWDGSQFDPNTGLQIPIYLPQTDRFTDVAFDAQYQYQGPNYWLTLRGTYIHENQKLDATFNDPATIANNIANGNPAAGDSTNPSNWLETWRVEASLAYGNDNRVVLTGQYFNTKGSMDAILYSGNVSQFDPAASVGGTPFSPAIPDTNGYVFEVAYMPFSSSQSPIWPWANMKVGLQYTYYNKFDGQSNFAHDNNTLFLYAWFAL